MKNTVVTIKNNNCRILIFLTNTLKQVMYVYMFIRGGALILVLSSLHTINIIDGIVLKRSVQISINTQFWFMFDFVLFNKIINIEYGWAAKSMFSNIVLAFSFPNKLN